MKEVHVRRLIGVVSFILAALGASAETDYAWKFDTSARAAALTAPVQATGRPATAWRNPYWVEANVRGITTPGLCIIFR